MKSDRQNDKDSADRSKARAQLLYPEKDRIELHETAQEAAARLERALKTAGREEGVAVRESQHLLGLVEQGGEGTVDGKALATMKSTWKAAGFGEREISQATSTVTTWQQAPHPVATPAPSAPSVVQPKAEPAATAAANSTHLDSQPPGSSSSLVGAVAQVETTSPVATLTAPVPTAATATTATPTPVPTPAVAAQVFVQAVIQSIAPALQKFAAQVALAANKMVKACNGWVTNYFRARAADDNKNRKS
jgi:hypothetical protein